MLVHGRLIKRYKRFLVDVTLDTGETITAHCPNTGSMKNCLEDGAEVWLSKSDNPKRKYAYTWERIRTNRGHTIGINTGKANQIVADAIAGGRVAQLTGYPGLQREAKIGDSRIDLLLTADRRPDCYVEVKSVTLLEDPVSRGEGYFPDSVSERGSKHLRELTRIAQQGGRAVLFFCVQHSGIRTVSAAGHIDPVYTATLQEARQSGVEVIAYKVRFNPTTSRITREIPVLAAL